MKPFIIAALSVLLVYLIFVFVTTHWDISLWQEPLRVMCACYMALAGVFSFVFGRFESS